MDGTQLLYGLLLLALVVLSAFFSGSETALMSLSRIRVRNMVDKGIPNADLVQKLLSDPGRLLSTLLIGNNIVNIVNASIATVFFIALLGNHGVPVAMLVTTLSILLFGEVIPKTWANHAPEKWATRVAGPIRQLMILLTPLISVFTWITNLVLKAVGGSPKRTSIVTEDEIKTVINLGQTEGVLDPEEKDMLTSIFGFRDTLVREVLVPRVDMFVLKHNLSVESAAKAVVERRYSRVPVYEGAVDNIIGLVYTKDLLKTLLLEPSSMLNSIIRPVMFVPEVLAIGPLLKRMQADQVSLAIVLDEYGATQGLVTIEDIVEEIVGEIVDEYDDSEAFIKTVDDRAALIDGGLAVDTVNSELGTSFPTDKADTIGGFVFFGLGRIPQVNDKLEYKEWELIVDQMQGRRITQVKVRKN